MWDIILSQLTGGGMILGIGVAIFLGVNKKRAVQVEGIDPLTGERREVTKWERGTRRSRWRGYCVIGGAVLGYQVPGLIAFLQSALTGATPSRMDVGYSAPCGMVFGLLAGLVIGAVISQHLAEKSRPPDPDAG